MYFFFGLALLNEFIGELKQRNFGLILKFENALITIIFTGFQIPLINKYKLMRNFKISSK